MKNSSFIPVQTRLIYIQNPNLQFYDMGMTEEFKILNLPSDLPNHFQSFNFLSIQNLHSNLVTCELVLSNCKYKERYMVSVGPTKPKRFTLDWNSNFELIDININVSLSSVLMPIPIRQVHYTSKLFLTIRYSSFPFPIPIPQNKTMQPAPHSLFITN